MLKIVKYDSYVETVELIQDGKRGNFSIRLSGKLNDSGVIRPRYPTSKLSFEKFEKRFLPASGFGVLVVSTSQGIMSHDDAKSRGIGGRLLCYAY